jgi:8-oxo-dGTP diphosphatase
VAKKTNPGPPKGPRLTVDAWIRDKRGRLLLVQRGRPPFRGAWSLPGGFVEWNERVEDACARETKEETGLKARVGEILGAYSDPGRDPRGHNVTILYAAKPYGGRLKGGDDAAEARWWEPRELRQLEFAFDHAKIIREQLAKRSRGRRVATRRPARRGGARG